MKLFVAVLIACSAVYGGDLRAHFQSATLDVQTDSTVNQAPDLPGLGQVEYVVSVSIKTTDFSASSFCVTAMVSLENGERGGVTKCVDKDPMDRAVAIQFSTGSVKPTAWLRLLVVRMHAEPADQLVNIFRR